MEGYKQNAKAYYDSIVNIESQFKYLYTALVRNIKDKSEAGSYIISEKTMSQMSQGGVKGGPGSQKNQSGRGRNQRGHQGAGNTENQDGRSVSAPPPIGEGEGSPVGERLNLERLGIGQGVAYPEITFNDFRSNAIDLANSIMDEEDGVPAVRAFQKFLQELNGAIKHSVGDWSRSGQATQEEVDNARKWGTYWTYIIGKKMDEIKRWYNRNR